MQHGYYLILLNKLSKLIMLSKCLFFWSTKRSRNKLNNMIVIIVEYKSIVILACHIHHCRQ